MKYFKIFTVFLSISVRVFLLIQIAFCIYLLVDYFDRFAYLALSVCFFIIFIDCCFIVWFTNHLEHKWYFFVCFQFQNISLIFF